MMPLTEYQVLTMDQPSIEECMTIDQLRSACRHDGPHVDPFDLLALIRLEEVLGVDQWRPGLLPSVYCVEAGWRSEAERGGRILGDYREGRAMAHGPMQLWPTSVAACRGTVDAPHDLVWSARCWVARVEAVVGKARRRCGAKADVWMVAEAAVSNVRKYRWDCRRGSRHWRVAVAALGGV